MMLFIDMYDDDVYTIAYIKYEWTDRRRNGEFDSMQWYYDSFKKYLHDIILDSLNGRNDLIITGLTSSEIAGFLYRLEGRKEQ